VTVTLFPVPTAAVAKLADGVPLTVKLSPLTSPA
jgi:hypothetical protein